MVLKCIHNKFKCTSVLSCPSGLKSSLRKPSLSASLDIFHFKSMSIPMIIVDSIRSVHENV